jgi:hypothetical protein
LEILGKFFAKWKIKINGDKTQAVYFTKRRKKELPTGPINVFGAQVEWAKEAKYLGAILDKTMTLKQHIEYVTGKVNLMTRILYPLLNKKSQLNKHNKLLLYKQVLRPMMTYACPILENIAKTHLTKLQVTQNKILKMALNLP